MKILITSDWSPLAVNGVVTSVKNLRRELINRGHEVKVLTLSQTRKSYEQDDVIFLGSITVGLLYPGARLQTAFGEKYIREILAWQPDVVHSQCEFSTFSFARYIARELDIPLVHTYHTVYEDYTHYFSPSVQPGKKAVSVFSRWISEQTDIMVAPTVKVQELLQKYQVKCPLSVIPSGIDLQRFHREGDSARRRLLRAEWKIPQDNLVLIYVGRLAEEKNIDELLRYRGDMSSGGVTLLLVGDGPDRSRLERRAAELGMEAPDVVFTGMVPETQVADWYQLGDLFVSASVSETQGLTYIEALASGIPILCRTDPCLDGVIRDGENGWQYHDETEFQKHLRAYLNCPNYRQVMKEAAQRSADVFSAQKFAERVEEIYFEQIELRKMNRERTSA